MAVTQVFPQFFVAPQVPMTTTTRVEIQYDEPPTPLTEMFNDRDYETESESPESPIVGLTAEFSPETARLRDVRKREKKERRKNRALVSSDDDESDPMGLRRFDPKNFTLGMTESDLVYPTAADSEELRKFWEGNTDATSSEDESSSSEDDDDGEPPYKRPRPSAIHSALQLERGDPVKAAARLLKAMRIS
jgi:hypothetical protein